MIVMVNRATRYTFSCIKIIFQVSKNKKKGYMKMIEKFYLETWKSVLGSSISHYYYLPCNHILSKNNWMNYLSNIMSKRHFTLPAISNFFIQRLGAVRIRNFFPSHCWFHSIKLIIVIENSNFYWLYFGFCEHVL